MNDILSDDESTAAGRRGSCDFGPAADEGVGPGPLAAPVRGSPRAEEEGKAVSPRCACVKCPVSFPAPAGDVDCLPRPGVVLVADDNVLNRFVLRIFLNKIGVPMVEVNEGAQAVEEVRRQIGRESPYSIRLIFTSLRMLVMDGIVTTRKIRQLEADAAGERAIPIVGTTTYCDTIVTNECLKVGMQEVLLLPLSLGCIEKFVKVYLGDGF